MQLLLLFTLITTIKFLPSSPLCLRWECATFRAIMMILKTIRHNPKYFRYLAGYVIIALRKNYFTQKTYLTLWLHFIDETSRSD